jgi:hypothetical protein
MPPPSHERGRGPHVRPPTYAAAPMEPQAGWLPDPTGRHEYRWWDGAEWTEVVADQGVESVDAPPMQQQVYEPQQPQPLPGPQHYGQAPGSRHGSLLLGVMVAAVAVLAVVTVAVVVDRGGGGDDDGGTDQQTATVAPREALITLDDLPSGWAVSEVGGAPDENKICEPRLEAPEPPREVQASFERSQPSGALGHTIIETTPSFAADYVADARRQADDCGTFSDEYEAGGESYSFTASSEVATGPTFGDQTLWYSIHVEYQEPAPSSHDVIICMDRHGGVISEVILSTSPPPLSDGDRAMVEDLIRTASDRLQGTPPASGQ